MIKKKFGMWTKSGPKKEIYSNTTYLKKQENLNNLTLHQKELEKEQQTKLKTSRRGEIIIIRAEINEIETNKQNNRSMKPETRSLKKLIKLMNL